MTFHVGQKVARTGGRETRGYSYPALNQPCTIANTYVAYDGELMLEFLEFPSPEDCKRCAGFRAKFFRPITERKTDISIFTAMLDRERRELPVRVIASNDQHAQVSPEPNETIQASDSL